MSITTSDAASGEVDHNQLWGRALSEPGDGSGPPLWTDLSEYRDNGIPEPPRPTICRRRDGVGLFYPGQVSILFGEPECGKTWIGLAAIVEQVNAGHRAAYLDMDHNGAGQTISRLTQLGVSLDALADPNRFRYVEPEDATHLQEVIANYCQWRASFVLVDSVGELMPIFGYNSNSPDDFTAAHARTAKPLARSGAAVVLIDHVSKNPDSKAQGPTGTAAKGRSVGGAMIRVNVEDTFVPGYGGSARLRIKKDRPGGLRAVCPTGDKEQNAGLFRLVEREPGMLEWAILTPDEAPAPQSETGAGSRGGLTVDSGLTKLRGMYPDGTMPSTVRGIRNVLHCSNDIASGIARNLKDAPGTFREQPEHEATGSNLDVPVPVHRGSPGTGTQEQMTHTTNSHPQAEPTSTKTGKPKPWERYLESHRNDIEDTDEMGTPALFDE